MASTIVCVEFVFSFVRLMDAYPTLFCLFVCMHVCMYVCVYAVYHGVRRAYLCVKYKLRCCRNTKEALHNIEHSFGTMLKILICMFSHKNHGENSA
jgi:hypothetical protein